MSGTNPQIDVHKQFSYAVVKAWSAPTRKSGQARRNSKSIAVREAIADRKKRRIPFTKAQIHRAVKAVEGAGIVVRGVTISPDGSVTVLGGEATQKPPARSDKLEGWEDI